jgi:cation-transporting P-type ATPase I
VSAQPAPSRPGRRRRRWWVGQDRTHIEVRGALRPGAERFCRQLEVALTDVEGVHWAQVNAIVGRVVVACDDGVDVESLVEVVEALEEAHEMQEETFPHHVEHPGDIEPLRRNLTALAADLLGIGLSVVARPFRGDHLSGEVAALVGLVDASPAVRRALTARWGPTVADLSLALVNAVAQGLTQAPLGLVVDGAHRATLALEAQACREAWDRLEPRLHAKAEEEPPAPVQYGERPAPLPAGPIERYTNVAGAAALAASLVTAAMARELGPAVTSTVAATPKAARLGREAFAAQLGWQLAHHDVLPMDPQVLRRLDRVDAVVVDASLLVTGRLVPVGIWPLGAGRRRAQVERVSNLLLAEPDSGPAGAADIRSEWSLHAPRGRLGELPPAVQKSAQEERRRGRSVLLLTHRGEPAAMVAVAPELVPLAEPLTRLAGQIGRVVLCGRRSVSGVQLDVEQVAPGGSRLAASVRALQAEGACVLVISRREHAALLAGDVGVGVFEEGQAPPWGADLILLNGLSDACLVLQAIPEARRLSRRSALAAAYGSGAAALLALSGPRQGATGRASVAVNCAALAAMALGAMSAVWLRRKPPCVPLDATPWHAMTVEAVMARLGSSAAGLGEAEARSRLGPAEPTPAAGGNAVVGAALAELANPLTPALATGAGLSAALGSLTDAVLIGSVMALNALISGTQQVGAHRALRSLEEQSTAPVTVRRSGREVAVPPDQLVPGDLVLLHPGDAVPADCRVVSTQGAEVDESLLTGESMLVTKLAEPAEGVEDRSTMLYRGTALAAGDVTAMVVATAAQTQLGRAAALAYDGPRAGGVEARLQNLTRQTIPVVLGAGAAILAAGLLRGIPVEKSLSTGVGLSVAAVPEGLPLVATLAEASAARRLSRNNVLVRRPSTLETLGRVDVLCADKTGTLTTGRLSLIDVWSGANGPGPPPAAGPGRAVLAAGLRASPAVVVGQSVAHPTDRAVIEAARELGVATDEGVPGWRVVAELPFEPSRGYHAVLGRSRDGGHRMAVKGAAEVVLRRCGTWLRPKGSARLSRSAAGQIQRAVDRLSRRGLRVLAVAERAATGRRDLRDDRVAGLEFVGLLAFGDPVRSSTAEAVAGLRDAGVAVIMLTGDHPGTAESIAAAVDLPDGGPVLTGADLDAMTDRQLAQRLPRVSVCARLTPAHKVRIVRALQEGGHVVAMTGDGANDAAAIRMADVGIALGAASTNAAKEAADVVVTDDKIETIIAAILEGRALWSSVREAVALLVGGNLGEILFTLGAGVLSGEGSPLNARQLLLVNLLTDLLPATALALRPPDHVDPAILANEGPDASLSTALTREILVRGAATATSAGLGWQLAGMTGISRSRASTVALVSLVGSQLAQTLTMGWRSPLVAGSTVASGAVLGAVVQTPGLSQFFGCRPLGPLGWGIAAGSSAASAVGATVAKAVSAQPRAGH